MKSRFPYAVEYLRTLEAKNESIGNTSDSIEIIPKSAPKIVKKKKPKLSLSTTTICNNVIFALKNGGTLNSMNSARQYYIGKSSPDVCSVYLSGLCAITVLRGKLTANGFTYPTGRRLEIFNPAWLPALELKLSNDVSLRNANVPQPASLPSDFNCCCILVEGLEANQQSWLELSEDQTIFKSCMPNQLLDSKIKLTDTLIIDEEYIYMDSAIISCNFQPFSEVLTYPISWIQSADQLLKDYRSVTHQIRTLKKGATTINSGCRAVICGAKGVGKSTCLRYVINRLLSESNKTANPIVFVIDCDLGQPEFNPPGLLSLHAVSDPLLKPCYMNLQQPLLSFFIGDITSRNEPELFILALKELFEKYQILSLERTEKVLEKSRNKLRTQVRFLQGSFSF